VRLQRRIYRYQQLRAKKGIGGEFSSWVSRARDGRSATARPHSPCFRIT